MNYLKINRFNHHLQVNIKQLREICRQLYKKYAPIEITRRRNVSQCKLSDITVLTLLIWQAKTGIESQRRFCESFCDLSHSRFNRRARQLLPLINLIRRSLNKEIDLSGRYMTIDSFPIPVCQPVRNRRVKIFRSYANIGYKATKKIYYYGFKVHAVVSDDGYILNYTVTKASVHDAKAAPELIDNTTGLTNRYILGDEGYIGHKLQDQLKQKSYILWTTYRKNMTRAKEHNNHELMAIRRGIETNFSLLTYYQAENNRARSLVGFQQRLEVEILASNLEYCLERFN